ncbi:hypothetical protein PVAP13_2KG239458 [Panicum virgatum]|uniref:Uncharacterized protein n=1 Tax=Panicum virgatum TaxID=38727 RepID=A0A8T0VZT7_PANVG|nr:hypothetical protein PVAP13_2KG239458 [Panicum virgatum]
MAIGRRPKINKKREEKTGAGPTLEFRSARPFVWSAVVPPLHTAVAPLPFPLFLPPPSSLEHASAARRPPAPSSSAAAVAEGKDPSLRPGFGWSRPRRGER